MRPMDAALYLERFRRDPLGFIEHLAHGGPMVEFGLGDHKAVFLNDPGDIGEVLAAPEHNFRKALGFSRARLFLDPSVFSREISWPTRAECSSWIDGILYEAGAFFDSPSCLGGLDAFDALKLLNLRILARTICNGNADLVGWPEKLAMDAIIEALNDVTLRFPTRPPDVSDEEKNRLQQVKTAVLRGIGLNMSDSRVSSYHQSARALTSLLAGYEQIPSLIVFSLYLLAHHPSVYDEVYQEIDAVDLRESMLYSTGLSGLKCVMMEALRLYPPAWYLARIAMRDVMLCGRSVAKNSLVFMSQYTVHRDSRFFSNSTQFCSSRWKTKTVRQPTFAYFPFSHGPRRCKGDFLVDLIATGVIGSLLRRFSFGIASSRAGVIDSRISLRPKQIRFEFSPRKLNG